MQTLLALLCAATPLSLPFAADDPSVPLAQDGDHEKVDGHATLIPYGWGNTHVHRLDAQRFVITQSGDSAWLYDRERGSLTSLHTSMVSQVGDRLVMYRGEGDICDIDPDTFQLRTIDKPGRGTRPVAIMGEALVLATQDAVRVVALGDAPRVFPLPTGLSPTFAPDALRGSRLLLVGAPPVPIPGAQPDLQRGYKATVPYTVKVSELDLATGRLRPLGVAAGQWMFIAMNCCSGYEPMTAIGWISAEEARRKLHPVTKTPGPRMSAVVDEWNEVVTFE